MGGIHIGADHKPEDEFIKWTTKAGQDCGLVFVTNKPFGTSRNVKLIVLAGYSGIGTLAAARALVQDFRYLEPLEDETCVYGVVQGLYSKKANSPVRVLRDVKWRYRKGGRSPIAVS